MIPIHKQRRNVQLPTLGSQLDGEALERNTTFTAAKLLEEIVSELNFPFQGRMDPIRSGCSKDLDPPCTGHECEC